MRYRLIAFTFMLIFSKLCESVGNKTLLRDYDRKVCANEPSCHLLNKTFVPKNRYSLKRRDCMCDAACVEYRDCCSDSPYYKIEEQSRPQQYYCSPVDKIYMKIDCPEAWSDELVAKKCAQFFVSVTNTDVSPYIPVTNPTNNVTYSNRYCALCNGDADYKEWTEVPSCGQVHEEFLASDGTIRSNVRLSIDYTKYRLEAHEIWHHVVYDHNTGYFLSRYNDKLFVCKMQRGLPKEIETNVRHCVPNVIEMCSDISNVVSVQKCNMYTSIVFLKNDQKKRYRNMDCAQCNGVSPSDVNGCPATLKE